MKIQEIRLTAEVLDQRTQVSDDLLQSSSSVVTGERALYALRKAGLEAKLSVLKQQLIQRQQQIEEVKVNISTAEETILLLEKQISIIEPLVKSGLSPETELLALQKGKKKILKVKKKYQKRL